MATKATKATEQRRCVGSKTFGIEAHDAPIADFPLQPSRKDGLGIMCKPHWTQYTGALRKAALARKAAALTPAQEAEIAERQAETGDAPKPRRSKATLVDATKAQKAEHAELERQLETVGGPETNDGQAILEAAAERAAALRVGTKRPSVEPVETPLGETIDSGTEEADAA